MIFKKRLCRVEEGYDIFLENDGCSEYIDVWTHGRQPNKISLFSKKLCFLNLIGSYTCKKILGGSIVNTQSIFNLPFMLPGEKMVLQLQYKFDCLVKDVIIYEVNTQSVKSFKISDCVLDSNFKYDKDDGAWVTDGKGKFTIKFKSPFKNMFFGLFKLGSKKTTRWVRHLYVTYKTTSFDHTIVVSPLTYFLTPTYGIVEFTTTIPSNGCQIKIYDDVEVFYVVVSKTFDPSIYIGLLSGAFVGSLTGYLGGEKW